MVVALVSICTGCILRATRMEVDVGLICNVFVFRVARMEVAGGECVLIVLAKLL